MLPCLYKDSLTSDHLQFGFEKKSSCIHTLFTVNESINYFTRTGSKVYCGFLDTSKGFDKVLHNGILKKKLFDKNYLRAGLTVDSYQLTFMPSSKLRDNIVP